MKYLTEYNSWVDFNFSFGAGLYIEKAGYFDERPEVHITLTQLLLLIALPFLLANSFYYLLLFPFLFFGYVRLVFHLPIKTGIQDCISASWGIDFFDRSVWLYVGGGGNLEGGRKTICIRMPWHLEFYKKSTLLNISNNIWHDEFQDKSKNKSFILDNKSPYFSSIDQWLSANKWRETHEFIDKFDGTKVLATLELYEYEHRPIWFKWTSLFAMKYKRVNIIFSQEVG